MKNVLEVLFVRRKIPTSPGIPLMHAGIGNLLSEIAASHTRYTQPASCMEHFIFGTILIPG